MGLEEEIVKQKNGSDTDLSDEGLAKLVDGVVDDKEDGSDNDDSKDSLNGQDDTSEADKTPEKKGDKTEEEGKGKVIKTDDGIESIEDAINMHKKDQQYISELQKERAELKKMMAPFVEKDTDGNYRIDKSKISQQVADDAGPSESQKKQAIEMFWKDFDKDPFQAIGGIVATMQDNMLKPYEQDMEMRRRKQAIDKLHKEKYNQYGDLRDAVENTLENNAVFGQIGVEGVDLAYKSVIGEAMPSIIENLKKGKDNSDSKIPTAPTGRTTGKDQKKLSEEAKIRNSIFESVEKDNYFK